MAQPVKGHGVVVREYGKLGLEELTFQPPGPNQVRLKIHACGICHSDLSAMTGKIPMPLPLVLGHEGAGVVEAVGPGVSAGPDGLQPGDWAVLTLVSPCGRCANCKRGRPAICSGRMSTYPRGCILDVAGKPVQPMTSLGCMADYAVVHEAACVKVGKDVPLEKCALVSCGVTTGTGAAMNCAKVVPGASCCIVGCGGVGLNTIQGCKICGADQIIAVDTLPSKLEAAKRFGATHTVNVKEVKDLVKEVRKLSGGGTDFGFEVIGLPETAQQAYDVVRPGGMAVMVGVPKPTDAVQVKIMQLLASEKILTGSFMGSGVPSIQVPLLIQLYQKGTLMLDELVSRYYLLKDAGAAIEDLQSGSNLRGVIVMHDLEGLAAGSASRL